MSQIFYRIRIHSDSVLSGTWREGTYAVHLPEQFDNTKQWQMAVESFQVKGNVIIPYMVTCPNIRQDNTYNTMAKNIDMNLLAYYGDSFHRDLSYESIGIPIRDPDFLMQKTITIRISDINGNGIAWDALGSDPKWLLTLVIWPAKTA